MVSHVIVSRNSSHRAAPLSELKSQASSIFGSDRVTAIESLSEALSTAIEQARLHNGVHDSNAAVLVAGSVITAGEARGIIRRMREKK